MKQLNQKEVCQVFGGTTDGIIDEIRFVLSVAVPQLSFLSIGINQDDQYTDPDNK